MLKSAPGGTSEHVSFGTVSRFAYLANCVLPIFDKGIVAESSVSHVRRKITGSAWNPDYSYACTLYMYLGLFISLLKLPPPPPHLMFFSKILRKNWKRHMVALLILFIKLK